LLSDAKGSEFEIADIFHVFSFIFVSFTKINTSKADVKHFRNYFLSDNQEDINLQFFLLHSIVKIDFSVRIFLDNYSKICENIFASIFL